eukprot:4203868-Pleurochrysis_carterae.AAC.2
MLEQNCAQKQALSAVFDVEAHREASHGTAGADLDAAREINATAARESARNTGLGSAVSTAVSAALASVLAARTPMSAGLAASTDTVAPDRVVDVTGDASADANETSVTAGVRYTLPGDSSAVLVWNVSTAQDVVAVVSDDSAADWRAIPRREFVDAAVVEGRDTAKDIANWLSSESLMPQSLPVEQVVFAPVSGHHKKKAPAGTLRGRYTPVPGLDGATLSMKEGWELFLAYTPGEHGSNYEKGPINFPVVAGQWLESKPPFVPAIKRESGETDSTNVSIPNTDVMGQLLGVLVGEETWCTLKDGERKTKSEFRRFYLVEIDSVAYFVQFDKLSCKHDPSRPRASVQHCIAQCVDASHKTRKPASIQSAMNAAAHRLSIAQTNSENRAAMDATAANSAGAATPGGTRRVSARQTELQQQQQQAKSAASNSQDEAAPTSTSVLTMASTPASTLPPSGISLGLHNFGFARLDPIQDLPTLKMSLRENGITSEIPGGEVNPVLWAKNELWRK